jgi:hypothetical protein
VQLREWEASVAKPQKSLAGDFTQNWHILAGDWKDGREISCQTFNQQVKN